jgi:O-antigen ligase
MGLFSSFKSAEYNDLPFRTALMSEGDHPTYVSMWYLFSCLLVLHRLFDRKSSLRMKMLGMLVILVLGSTTLLLSAKVAIVAFFMAFLLLLYLYVKRKRDLLVIYALSATIFCVSIMQVSFLRARFIDEFNVTQLKPPVGLATTSLNLRVGVYLCSWKVFMNNILIGVGIGDSQHELNSCYNQYDTNAYREGAYNTHNNYLAFAVSGGIIGLGLFLLNMGFHLNRSAALNNRLFLIFLVFFMILLIGENILSRNHGVVFYSLFCALLARQNLQNEPTQ